MFFLILSFSSCDKTSTKSPEGTVKLLFEYTQKGEMTKIKELISSGYLDNYDMEKLRALFIQTNTNDIDLEVIENSNQKALVRIKLKTQGSELTCIEPLQLIYQDGGWKIDYSGWKWPNALTIRYYN